MDLQATATLAEPPSDREGAGTRPAARCWLAAAAWVAGTFALFALFLRISLSSQVNSDGAVNGLQAWDLLHGNVLLRGWWFADVNFYFFELPLNAITAAVFGLGNFAAHVASALTYLFVAVLAVALVVTGSRGTARVARCAVVIMVLAAPLLTMASLRLVLEEPDHIGTSVFILGSFLLIDRVPARRFTAPVLCLILMAGQFSDMTVRYVAVPAVVLACGYRAMAARRLRSADTALVVAAVASVPLAMALSAMFVRLGGFTARPPWAQVAASCRGHLGQHPRAVRRGTRIRHQDGRRGIRLRAGLPAGRRVRSGVGGVPVAAGEPGRASAVRRDRLQPWRRRDLHGGHARPGP